MTKKEMLKRLEMYRKCDTYYLSQVYYGRYSAAKERAFDWCCDFAGRKGAIKPVKILSANSQIFTVGFETEKGYWHITPNHKYFLDYETGKVTG